MNLETKALVDKANELLAIWQEQKKTTERMWDEQTAAHDVRACWRSTWDILPDDLSLAERRHAAKHGTLSDRCQARLEKEMA